ncbi:hypothetical protein AT251_24685, partial [Enterovibrio nigricans]
MPSPIAQQAAIVAAVKAAFNVRPMDLDPFRSGQVYGKQAVLEINTLHAFASLEVVTDLPLQRLGRVSLERNNKEIIGIDAAFFHKRDIKKGLPVQAKGVAGATQTRLIIPFADETLRTLQGIRRGELVHQAGELLMLKIGVKQKVANDPDIPEFTANAVWWTTRASVSFSSVTPRPLSRIRKRVPSAMSSRLSGLTCVYVRCCLKPKTTTLPVSPFAVITKPSGSKTSMTFALRWRVSVIRTRLHAACGWTLFPRALPMSKPLSLW